MDQSTAAPGRRLATVEVTDCPACLSAGSVRRGVCDICGARSVETTTRPLRPDLPAVAATTDEAIPA